MYIWHVAINESPCAPVTLWWIRGAQQKKTILDRSRFVLKAFLQADQSPVRYWMVRHAVRHPKHNISGFQDARFVCFIRTRRVEPSLAGWFGNYCKHSRFLRHTNIQGARAHAFFLSPDLVSPGLLSPSLVSLAF